MKRFICIIVLALTLSAASPAYAAGMIIQTIKSQVQSHVQAARDQHAQNQVQERQASKPQPPAVVEGLVRSISELVGLPR